MTEAIYALLKRDAELLSKVLPGEEPPPPLLYDPEGIGGIVRASIDP